MRRTISALSSIGLLDSSCAWLCRNSGARRRLTTTRTRIGGEQQLLLLRPTFTPTRLLGAKVGSTTTPGEVHLDNDQSALENIDMASLRSTVSKIRRLIGYETYDVSLYLVDDQDMQEANRESRGVDEPTDILSFPFHEAIKPGTLEEPPFDVADYYNLGDMLVDVRYVMRRCEEDKSLEEDGEEYEDDDDRGVSGAMAKVFDPEKRIHMLLVHGLLHLVGHDHEEDDEYELMVTKEEELLEKLGLVP